MASAAGVRKELIKATRDVLDQEDGAYGVILSGGVDTAAVVEAIKLLNDEDGSRYPLPDLVVTVFASEDATDRKYAPEVAKAFGVEHRIIETTCESLIANDELLDLCVATLETFDGMELRNSLIPALAIKTVVEETGIRRFLTGDGSDELLGGYSFFWGYGDEEFAIRRKAMVDGMSFSAPKVGAKLGARVVSPYLQKSFIDFGLTLGKADCIGERPIELYPGYPRELHQTGKLCLREAFPESLAAWRRKDPIEVGSGSTLLSKPGFWEAKDVDIPDANQAKVVIRDKEHATYFKAFLRCFPSGRVESKFTGTQPCVGCGHDLYSDKTLFCRTCGAWPARRMLMSWSSGKDSCWAYYVMKGGIKALMTNTSGDHVKVHKSVPLTLLREQAQSIGLPLLEINMEDTVPNTVYEKAVKQKLISAKEQFDITSVCYGDLFVTEIVEWRKSSLEKMDLGLHASFPLYTKGEIETRRVALEMIRSGLKAIVVVVDTEQCGVEFLGREFDVEFVEECEKAGVDPCGENGEFHTFVYAGPMFTVPISFEQGGVVDEGRFVYQTLVGS
ncbi:hypothetical protein BSKO_13077 [Bryopsis sp. KO-2023]|nr:hypothetical protein BSKO_13077 [Bryopsis sp. KO-2023]